jgi:hypothetical protein
MYEYFIEKYEKDVQEMISNLNETLSRIIKLKLDSQGGCKKSNEAGEQLLDEGIQKLTKELQKLTDSLIYDGPNERKSKYLRCLDHSKNFPDAPALLDFAIDTDVPEIVDIKVEHELGSISEEKEPQEIEIKDLANSASTEEETFEQELFKLELQE